MKLYHTSYENGSKDILDRSGGRFHLIYPKSSLSHNISMKFDQSDQKHVRYIRNPINPCPVYSRMRIPSIEFFSCRDQWVWTMASGVYRLYGCVKWSRCWGSRLASGWAMVRRRPMEWFRNVDDSTVWQRYCIAPPSVEILDCTSLNKWMIWISAPCLLGGDRRLYGLGRLISASHLSLTQIL